MPANKRHLKIGTRGSLLAVTQCTLIKEELEIKTGCSFELVQISTQGDQIVDKPLWQLEGKDFFTKELDAALLKKEVDLVVHSYKDLGSERPEGIEIAAITERQFAHDILLIKNSTIKKLENLETLVVGTSSPRRIVNIESSLKPLLPNFPSNGKVECKVLRGNVNTRIQKLRDNEYDAIVLAFAGIERLAHREDSAKELEKLLKDLNFMVLPQKIFPSSASQGALAIEYCTDREDAGDIKNILSSVHHDQSAEEIRRERKTFNSFGGGCHLAVGIYVKQIGEQFIEINKGKVDDKIVENISLSNSSSPNFSKAFIGLQPNSKYPNIVFDELLFKKYVAIDLPNNYNFFVTTKYVAPNIKNQTGLWAAGETTASLLINDGFWVNGITDFNGHNELVKIKQSKALKYMLSNQNWGVLSHNLTNSPVGETFAGYERTEKTAYTKFEAEVLSCDLFYWTSYAQYQTYLIEYPKIAELGAQHCCGLGFTLEQFTKNGVKVIPIIDLTKLMSQQ